MRQRLGVTEHVGKLLRHFGRVGLVVVHAQGPVAVALVGQELLESPLLQVLIDSVRQIRRRPIDGLTKGGDGASRHLNLAVGGLAILERLDVFGVESEAAEIGELRLDTDGAEGQVSWNLSQTVKVTGELRVASRVGLDVNGAHNEHFRGHSGFQRDRHSFTATNRGDLFLAQSHVSPEEFLQVQIRLRADVDGGRSKQCQTGQDSGSGSHHGVRHLVLSEYTASASFLHVILYSYSTAAQGELRACGDVDDLSNQWLHLTPAGIFSYVLQAGIRPFREEHLCYDSCAPRIMPESVIRAALWRCKPHAPATTMIKEDADYGSDQTQDTGNGRRGDGDGRSAARVCSADWARRSCHVLLRKRPRSHPL